MGDPGIINGNTKVSLGVVVTLVLNILLVAASWYDLKTSQAVQTVRVENIEKKLDSYDRNDADRIKYQIDVNKQLTVLQEQSRMLTDTVKNLADYVNDMRYNDKRRIK